MKTGYDERWYDVHIATSLIVNRKSNFDLSANRKHIMGHTKRVFEKSEGDETSMFVRS